LGVGESVSGGGGDFLLAGVLIAELSCGGGGDVSRLRFCPVGLEVEGLRLACDTRRPHMSAFWKTPGSVGLSGRGMMGGSFTQKAGGKVGLKNGGSPFSPRF
jgi:hypothetical protein